MTTNTSLFRFVFFSVLVLFAPLSAFLLLDRGLDLTDEGYYLNFLNDPAAYDMSSFFAIVYQPMMQIANGDIATVRVLNFLSLYISALVFAFSTIWSFLRDQLSRSNAFLVSLTIAGVVVLYLRNWLPTPSYNSLNLLGLLWFGTGVALVFGAKTAAFRISALMPLGVGIGLCGAAKPTTGIALILIVVVLLAAKNLRPLEVLITGAAALTVIAPLVFFFGGPAAFIQNLRRASEAVAILGGGQLDFLSWERFAVLPDYLGVLVVIILFAILSTGLFVKAESKAADWLFFGTSSAAVLFFFYMNEFWQARSSFMELAASVPALVLVSLTWLRRSQLSRLEAEKRLAILVLASLPIAYVLGTGTSYLKGAGSASIFWIAALAIFIFSQRIKSPRSEYFSGAVSVFVILCLSLSVHLPYRQEASLFEQSSKIDNGSSLSEIRVSTETKAFLENLEEKFDSNDPGNRPVIIDLTGDIPSAVAILGGFQPGMPWYLSGSPGSLELVEFSLSGVNFTEFEQVNILHSGSFSSKENSMLAAAFGISGVVISQIAVNDTYFPTEHGTAIQGFPSDLRITVIRPSIREN